MAANTAFSQQALAKEARFQLRLQNALTKVAWEVLEEDASTQYHAERAAYAQRVLGNGNNMITTAGSPAQVAIQLATSFVNRPNVFAFETSYSFEAGSVVTAAGDADIESQLHTDWNALSGAGITTEPPALMGINVPPMPPAPR